MDAAQGQKGGSRRLVLGVPGRSIAAVVEACRGGVLRYAAHERLRSAGVQPGDLLYLGGFDDGRLALLGRIAVKAMAEPGEASALLGEQVKAFCAIGGAPFTQGSADRLVPHATARALRTASGGGLRFTRAADYELHPAALVGVLEVDEASAAALDELLPEVEAPEPPAPRVEAGSPAPSVAAPGGGLPVAEILSRRAANALLRAGIATLEEAAELSKRRLAGLAGLGRESVGEIRSAILRHGLPPPQEPPRARAVLSTRDDQVVRRRASGETLAEIAASIGVSRERVRQIVRASGGPDGRSAGEARREQGRKKARAHRTAILDAWRAGSHPREIAAQRGMAARDVQAFIRAEAGDGDRAARMSARSKSRGRAARVFSDAELVDAVRKAAAAAGGTPSSNEYGRIARAQSLPSLPTLTNRLGSWNKALAAAGLTPPPAHRSYTRRWTEEACLEAVGRVAVEEGRLPSVQRYEAIAKGREDLPSSATIRLRLGTWAAVISRLSQ